MQNNANEMAVFNTAIYVRLSKEDIVAAQSGRESNSITNQKQLVLDFLKDKPEFNIVSIRIDDGYTGTNFDRPAFQRMLNDIKAGRINCVVVKDLSRFGREYINSGKYIHRLFPVLGVRLIAINDNIDTITRDESSEFSITLKNLMNDNYSRDISVKVRSQLQVKRKHGDFICPFAPYGYQKCEGNHNRIEPDPYAATVVQDIFNWKIQGMTNNGIAIRLAESGILAPLEYKRHKGEPLFSGFKMKERCEWTAQAVARILTNPIYIGTLRQGLRRRPNYKIKKSIPTEENEWVVIHDAHEPVVTKRTFYLAQKALLIDTRAEPRQFIRYPACWNAENAGTQLLEAQLTTDISYTAISAAACARKRIAVNSSRYQRHRLRQLSFSYCKSISARWLSSTGVYLKFSRCHIRKSMLPSVSSAEKNLRQKSLVIAI